MIGHKWDPKNPVAPFTKSGSLMDYPARTFMNGELHDPEWRGCPPFRAIMHLKGMQRGYSAARFIWTGEDGSTYPMFMKDMERLLVKGEVRKGRAYGLWKVTKRGQNYGIAWVEA